MNKKQVLSLLFCSLLLTACRTPLEKSEPVTSKPSVSKSEVKKGVKSVKRDASMSVEQSVKTPSLKDETTESTSEDVTQSSEEMPQATDATFNGSYYTAPGKYGDIVIVNKKHPLSPSYNPGEDPTASAAFQELLADMQNLGYAVSNQYSGFRSYDTQAGLYQSYVNRDSKANADRYSARAGYSEHQTGLAYDLIDTSGNLLTEPSASAWLAENAHHYGFIVRYLPEKESITGYMAESWHVRYIGREAKDIYKSGLTLEEYLGVEGGDYPN